MMHELLRRAEQLAQTAQLRRIGKIAEHIRELVHAASVEIEGTNIVISGRSFLKRWLIDPSLRFLGGRLR